jgi:hypothetical protein
MAGHVPQPWFTVRIATTPPSRPELRTDRQIDFAGDDDEHHAAGEHAGDRHLPEQVGQIARRDEGCIRLDVEEQPDERDRDEQREDLVTDEQLLDLLRLHGGASLVTRE